MFRQCNSKDFKIIYNIINDAAQAYKGVIPKDCWMEPYMSEDELHKEIRQGVVFAGYEEDGELVGVMGIQPVKDVVLIRHAYVKTAKRNHGIGGKLLSHLLHRTKCPVLIGTWADAAWAIRFYQKYDFRLVSPEEKDRLLKKYWGVPQHQIANSVVLADQKWFKTHQNSLKE